MSVKGEFPVCATYLFQYTLEKVGKAGTVTEFGSEFDTLSHHLDNIKRTTEKLLEHVEAVMHPYLGKQ